MKKPLVIITGASSGIGEATAKLFAQKNHPLLLIARRIKKLEALGLPNTICKKVDIRELDALKEAILEAERLYGPCDCLINNAGVMMLGKTNLQDPKQWQTMTDTNIIGMMNGIHSVLSNMVNAQAGTIVNISSIAGRKTFPDHAVYCATKHAVHALSENIRAEVASSNVRIITIAPGAVETELLEHTTDQHVLDDYQAWKKEIATILAPIDIANAIWYAYSQPQSICIREIVITPTKQEM